MKKQLLKLRYAILSVLLVLLSVNVNAQEQMLVGWQFLTSGAGTNGVSLGNEPTYNSTSEHVGVNTSVLSRGVGLRPYGLTSAFSAVPEVKTPDAQSAITENAFYEFSFQPKTGYKMSLSQLNFKLRTSGTWSLPANATPLNFIWKYSIDNGTTFTDIGTVTQFSAAVQDIRQPSVLLSNIADLQKLPQTTTVIFRLYVWGFTNNPGNGTFSLGRSTTADPIALAISGTPYDLSAVTSNINEAYFTDTKAIEIGKPSEVIIDKLISLIENTPTGENIHLSIYLINHQRVMDALKAAEVRAVNLHLIVDMSRSDSQITNASSLPWLQANLPNSEIIVSVNDVSPNAINHHKFALFSKVETSAGVLQTVTFQTSHNFTVSDTKKVQDALIFNNAGVYQAFLTNWQTIKTYAASGMGQNYVYNTFTDNANGVKLAFFPKIGPGVVTTEDDIVQSLNAITDVANSKIRIAMSDWTDSRPAIIDKLIALRAQGATIEVYTRDAIGTQTKVKLAQLRTAGATVRIFNVDAGAAAKFNIHAKITLIEGTWNGQSGAKVIMTGSHNYTDGALKTNNEVLVTLVNSALFSEYDVYLNDLKTIMPTLPLVEFDFSTITGAGTTNSNFASFESTVVRGGVANGMITRGAGLKGTTGISASMNSNPVAAYSAATPSTFADAMANDEYLQIVFDSKNAAKASLNKIEWAIRKSATSALNQYRWYYSVDSEVNADFKAINTTDQVMTHSNVGLFQQVISLDNIADLQAVGPNKKVYLRLYIFNSVNASSTVALRNTDGSPAFTLFGDVEQDLTNNLLGWDFSTSTAGGTRSDGNEVFIKSNINNSNLNAAELRRGPGLNAIDAAVTLQRGFTSVSTELVQTLAEAVNFGNYYSFHVTPKENVKVSLAQLAFNLRRSSNGGDTYLWKYKINDGEFVSLGQETTFTSTNTNGVYQPVVKLNQIAELQNVKVDSVVFRLYVWNFKLANSGTFAIGRSADSYDVALQLTGTTAKTTLPVTLTKFDAKKVNNRVGLNWTTLSEQNNSHFEVLKSTDAKFWTNVTTVRGAGNSNQTLNYRATDFNPANGMNYYQLKQVDFDGKTSLSDVVSVAFEVAAANSMTANYRTGTLTASASGFTAGDASVIVYNLNGQKLATKTVYLQSGVNQIVISTSLPAGLYVITVNGAKERKSVKFVAQN